MVVRSRLDSFEDVSVVCLNCHKRLHKQKLDIDMIKLLQY